MNALLPSVNEKGGGKRVAIMQPYFLPYIGYFQLIAAVDVFVVYDNIKYTKKGWINRNRMLQNGTDVMFSLPLQAGSDSLDVVQRSLVSDFNPHKMLNQIAGAYRRAPEFEPTMQLLQRIFSCEDKNLFQFILNSIDQLCQYLKITTTIKISSELPIDHQLKGEDKVIAICKNLNAKTYLNSIGGLNLYQAKNFQNEKIELRFIKSNEWTYFQFGQAFVPWLSIIDVLMFNSLDAIKQKINLNYQILCNE